MVDSNIGIGHLGTQVIWGPEIASIREDWEAFADTIEPENFFIRPAVLDAWQSYLTTQPNYGVIVVRRDSVIIGVMPIMRRFGWRRPTLGIRYDYDPLDRIWLTKSSPGFIPVRQVGPVLSLPATMGGPIISMAPENDDAVIGQIAHVIAKLQGWDLSVLPIEEHLLPAWQKHLTAAGLQSKVHSLNRESLSLAKLAPIDEVVSRQSQKRRQNFRRARAAGERIGLLTRVCRDAEESTKMVARLAAKSWKATGRGGEHTSIPYEGPQQKFIESLILGTDSSNMVTCVMESEDEPVAIVLGVGLGGRLITLLTYWDGRYPDASPGTMAMAGIINWANDQDLNFVDFNSGATWLRIFADEKLAQHNLIVFGRGRWGAALYQIQRFAVLVREKMKGR